MNTPDTEWEKTVEEALDILHEAIQHTPIKLSETNGTEYDKGYIFYQDMVVRDVLDNTPKLKKLLTDAFTSRDTYWKERVKTLKKADQIIIHKTLGGGYVCFNPSLVYPANTKIQPVFGKTPEDALSHHLQALDNLK